MAINTSKKLAGILVPAFSLRTPGDLGIGDTAAVRDAINFCHQYCLGVLQLLPISETGGDNSPYNAISSMALDPALIYISSSAPDKVPGLIEEHWRDLLDFDIKSAEIKGPIDYPAVKNRKHFFLQKTLSRSQLGHSGEYAELKNDFEVFLAFQVASSKILIL